MAKRTLTRAAVESVRALAKDRTYHEGLAWIEGNVYQPNMDIYALAASQPVQMLAALTDTADMWVAQAVCHLAEVAQRLPQHIVYSYQPYTNGAVLTDLRWDTETERDYNNGGVRKRTVLRGTVVSGTERGFLAGMASTPRDISGQTVTIYGVKRHELDRGEIVRVAG